MDQIDARSLVYRFFGLPHVVRLSVARKAGLLRDGEGDLGDKELFALIFSRVDANSIGRFRAEIEAVAE